MLWPHLHELLNRMRHISLVVRLPLHFYFSFKHRIEVKRLQTKVFKHEQK